MTALLETREVSKFFGNVVALKDISVSVGAGEVTCVLGDNGAGKSSFIKILSGVHRHDEGAAADRGRGDALRQPARGQGAGASRRSTRTSPRSR